MIANARIDAGWEDAWPTIGSPSNPPSISVSDEHLRWKWSLVPLGMTVVTPQAEGPAGYFRIASRPVKCPSGDRTL